MTFKMETFQNQFDICFFEIECTNQSRSVSVICLIDISMTAITQVVTEKYEFHNLYDPRKLTIFGVFGLSGFDEMFLKTKVSTSNH